MTLDHRPCRATKALTRLAVNANSEETWSALVQTLRLRLAGGARPEPGPPGHGDPSLDAVI
eukprot:11195389-Lingulodinium_polyedra.AAC.1